MNNYLIPANANRGKLIFGYFRPIDLIILIVGFVISFIMLAVVPLDTTLMVILAVLPVMVCGLLVLPMPYYHNVLVAIQELINFFNSRRKYIWKGWCYERGDSNR